MSQMTDKATEMMDSDSVVSIQTLIAKLKTEPKIKLNLSKKINKVEVKILI